jgi:hypothetical protein
MGATEGCPVASWGRARCRRDTRRRPRETRRRQPTIRPASESRRAPRGGRECGCRPPSDCEAPALLKGLDGGVEVGRIDRLRGGLTAGKHAGDSTTLIAGTRWSYAAVLARVGELRRVPPAVRYRVIVRLAVGGVRADLPLPFKLDGEHASVKRRIVVTGVDEVGETGTREHDLRLDRNALAVSGEVE